MTAIDRVTDIGEYRPPSKSTSLFDHSLKDPFGESGPAKRLLIKVLLRALFDYCMYPKNNPKVKSAEEWLSNPDSPKFNINLSELLRAIGMGHIQDQIVGLVTSGGVHKEKIIQMKRLLYRYDG